MMLDTLNSSDDDFSDDGSVLADEPCVSLFDPDRVLASAEDCLRYDSEQYQFDLRRLRRQNRLTFYDVVKIVNFARTETAHGTCPATLIASIEAERRAWDHDRYLKPFLLNDPLLFSIDDDDDDDCDVDLKAENDALRAELEKMKATFRQVLDLQDDDQGERNSASQATMNADQKVRQLAADQDRDYFRGYSAVDIHEEMLRDTARTRAYQTFCDQNRHLFEGKVVLDVGCGSGILCLFAARAGARRVLGIDNADIVHRARRAVQRNGFDDVIEILQGKVEEIELDCKVDLIISEWMGYFLLYV